jgi:hypothetical protein
MKRGWRVEAAVETRIMECVLTVTKPCSLKIFRHRVLAGPWEMPSLKEATEAPS